MLEMRLQSHICSHILARLMRKSVVITYNATGITILQYQHTKIISWLEIIRPILFDTSWFGGRLTIVTVSETFTFKLLPYTAQRTHHTLMLDYWLKTHTPELKKTLHQIQQSLTLCYFRSSQQLTLQSDIKELAERWLALPQQALVSPELENAIDKLAALSPMNNQQLHRCRSYFIQRELAHYKTFFDHLSERPLTEKQRQACVINDDNNLVLAGAGSGKTTVMVGRVAYLLQCGLAQPAKILLLAYGKDAALEMDARLKSTLQRQDIKCATFHSLALSIITQVKGCIPIISEFATNSELKKSWLLEQFYGFIKAQSQYKKHIVDLLNLNQADEIAQINPTISFDVLIETSAFTALQNQVLRFFDVVRAASLSHTVAAHYFADAASQHTFECYVMLVKPLLLAYKKHLETHQALDFDNMIFSAIEMIQTGQFKASWQHILVDEFQDISEPRAQLLQALTSSAPDSRLFAVGDDWQSIYRFSGSNHYFITHFHDYFGAGCTVNLDQTFRFNNKIAQVANNFVMQNPAQLKKELTAKVVQNTSAVTIIMESKKDHQNADLTTLIDALSLIDSTASASVYILARFSFLLPNSVQLASLKQRFMHLTLDTYTVHSSKGKEADYVVLVGLNDGKYGFPTKQHNDIFVDAYLPKQDEFVFAEERRLFYVALTRAKKHVYLLAPPRGTSVFVTELMTEQYDVIIHQSDVR